MSSLSVISCDPVLSPVSTILSAVASYAAVTPAPELLIRPSTPFNDSLAAS